MAEIIMGIDHGNGNMKGVHVNFPCGLVRYTSEPGRFMNEDILEYNGVYYTADYGSCSAESPSYQVKLKKSDKSPVQSTDYYKDKADLIKHTITPSAIIVFTAKKVLFTKNFV